MDFQFLLKSVTLDNTEGRVCTLVSKILVFSEFTVDFRIIIGKNAAVLTVTLQWLNVDRCWRTGPWLSATFSRNTPAITRAW